MTIRDKILIATERVRLAIDTYNPIAVCGLLSGGHDSLSATYIASLAANCFTFYVVHLNTGIGVQATRDFVYTTCNEMGWKLLEFKASENTKADGTPDPQIYRQLALRYGFPGPGQHGTMYIRLKERGLARLARMLGASCKEKNKRRILLVNGARSQESVRRMGHVVECELRGREIWSQPIHDWTKLDTTELIKYAELKRNVVVDLIHKSGECLCGAFGEGVKELEELNQWDITRPAYNEICALQKEVAANGKHAAWGTRPPGRRVCKTKPGLLCNSCNK